MSNSQSASGVACGLPRTQGTSGVRRLIVIGLISFLTLVDLFAAQAILPELVRAYQTTPAMMGVAVNASTIGMAAAGIVVALFSRDLNRRRGIWVSLMLLAIPTALLASAPNIAWFTALRVAQGLCMSTAFTLTMAYLAEQSGADDIAGALAAYVTGNVMSNLVGRVVAAAVTDTIGLQGNFYTFAALNLAGAALVYFGLGRTAPMRAMTATMGGPFSVLRGHLRNPALRTSFAIGFVILFAFIGTFTYVNFVLVRGPISLSMMSVGLVYFVFVPAVLTTPFAGLVVRRIGLRPAFISAIVFALAGLPFLLVAQLQSILLGLVMVGVGTFFAQAIATGFVGRAAETDRATASGIYLACYYVGGIAGSAIPGALFQAFGWPACVAATAVALAFAVLFGTFLKLPTRDASSQTAQS
jgi:MFS transporter, YNFM family, putative membrane transport protein